MESKKERFNHRAFVAVMMGLAAIMLPVSGLLLHAYSEGEITSGGHSWFMLHILSGVLFVIFFIWHIVLNRRALAKHIKSHISGIVPLSREAGLALIIVLLIVIIIFHNSF